MTDSQRQRGVYRVTIIGSIGNLALVIFKLLAGIIGHSAAMIADGIHSVSDFVTDIIVVIFVKIAGKPRDGDHHYGHGKYETLATAVIGLILFAVGIGILLSGCSKIYTVIQGGTLEAPGMLALIAAIVSIVVKEALYRYTVVMGRRLESQAVVANAWHHRSDALSSIATAIGIGGAILLGSHWRVLDPIAAVIVSVLIVKVSIQLFVPSINELLEKSLPIETERQILDVINSFGEVAQPHNLRTHMIGPIASIDVHVRMDPDLTVRESHEVTRHIEQALHDKIDPRAIINIHVEPQKPA